MIQEILYLGQCHKRRRPSLCIKVTKKSSIFSCYTNILKTAQGVTYHWLHLSCLWLVRCPRNYSCPRWVVWWSFSACAIPWFKAPAWFPFPQVRSGRCRARTTLRRSVSAKWVAWLVLRGVQGRVAVLAGCIIPGKDWCSSSSELNFTRRLLEMVFVWEVRDLHRSWRLLLQGAAAKWLSASVQVAAVACSIRQMGCVHASGSLCCGLWHGKARQLQFVFWRVSRLVILQKVFYMGKQVGNQ